MSDSRGKFVWYELMTTDVKAARAFYGDVVGWTPEIVAMPGMDYTMLMADGAAAGGLMELPSEARRMGTPPSWIGYVGVDDVDAAAAKVTALGGTVHVQPRDIPNIGRFSIFSDPTGAMLALFHPSSPDQAATVSPGTVGHFGWHDLRSTDWSLAFKFYAALFGWEESYVFEMGVLGTYQMFALNGQPIGGMFTKAQDAPGPSQWQFYVCVKDIDVAIALTRSGGGTAKGEATEIPGGAFSISATDPQGAAYGLFGPRA